MKHKDLVAQDSHSPSQEKVENSSGSDIAAFRCVTYSGFGTNYQTAVLAGPSDDIRGITYGIIQNNQQGYILVYGLLYNIDTSAWTVGTSLYCGAGGVLTDISGGGPQVANVRKSHATLGVIQVTCLDTPATSPTPFIQDTDSVNLDLVGPFLKADVNLSSDAASAGNVKSTTTIHALPNRGLHVQNPVAAPSVELGGDSVNAEGSAASLSRSDHTHGIATGAPSSQAPDQANAEGTSNNLARADHTHNIPADAPTTTLSPATTNSEGSGVAFARNDHTHAVATGLVGDLTTVNAGDTAAPGTVDRFSRADHQHPVATAAPASQAPDQANAEGASTSLARADHVHNIPADAPTTPLSPATTNAEGTGVSFARNDHTHAVATGLAADISTIQPDDAAAAGTVDKFARADHKHAIVAAAPTTALSPATTNAEGSGTSFARNDHTHAVDTGVVGDITTIQPDDAAAAGTANRFARADHRHAIAADAPSTQNPDQANAEGSSASFARADHIHNIPADAPTTTLSPATTNAEGVGTSFARNDHTHAIATGIAGEITTIQPDDAANAGTVDKFARIDHRHAIVAAAPVNTGTANAEGSGTSFARNDHVHDTTISQNSVRATAAAASTSATDVLITSMTLTPAAGTYLVMFEAAAQDSNNTATMTFSLYVGGTQVTNTERGYIPTNATIIGVVIHAVVSVNGSQAIEARYRTSAGTVTANGRSLTIVRMSA